MASGLRQLPFHESLRALLIFLLLLSLATGFASPRLTGRQVAAFERYVGKTYWIVSAEGKLPFFRSAPTAAAESFVPQAKESFQITEMVEGATQNPYYYKVEFETGRQGYIDVDSFLEQLNLTLLTVDPDQGQKRRTARQIEEESRREARIRAQPWPEHIKEAVLRRQAVLGMTMREAREALGKPSRTTKISDANPLIGTQEQWIYEGGPVLTFTNGLITRIQPLEAKRE